ncbi:MAG TPA: o-succinylbenzoate synthase [Actinomycetales bacterium]|nr:o-succinylbenzoate synthase [Actinomycetales bacterium]
MTPPTPVAFRIPMRTRFRGITAREGVVFRGAAGWAEFSPFLDYGPAQAVPWLDAAREAAAQGFPPAVRAEIPVNVTIPAVDASHAAQLVADSGGCTTAKVKVAEPGQDLDQETNRLAAVREALGPAGKIRIDANGAWDVETAVRHIAALDRAAGGLEYVEQPCATVADLARVRRRVSVPIAADESIRHARDPFEVARTQAADIVVLKVQPLGGVRACLELAEQIAMPVVVSSALETSIGLAAGVALAAALPELPYACGLATGHLLENDLTSAPLRPHGGAIAVRQITPEAELLDAVQNSKTSARWRKRWEATAVLARKEQP